jgi:exodeoxyribonuclease VII large subunit
VVSAIGHEVDTPLLDLVADVRASTPTDAAKRVVPDVGEEGARIAELRRRSRSAVLSRLDREQHGLDTVRSRPVLDDPTRAVDERERQVSELRERARRGLSHRLDRAAEALGHTRARVAALSPAATLARGYAVVQRSDGTVVRRPADVTTGDLLRLRLAEGEVPATVA